MQHKSLNLFQIPLSQLLEKIRSDFTYTYDFAKHRIELQNNRDEPGGFVRLPLAISMDENLNVLSENNIILYLSIESGKAALIVMHRKETLYHTTFSAYMTRKKQGFSQIKYLKKKGKSRAGSRVRLVATLDFFESINNKTKDLFDQHNFSRIALNCSTTLIPFLYQSKVPPPFKKNDSRLYKIPVHISDSNYKSLESAIKKLMAPTLFYKEEFQSDFEVFFELLKKG